MSASAVFGEAFARFFFIFLITAKFFCLILYLKVTKKHERLRITLPNFTVTLSSLLECTYSIFQFSNGGKFCQLEV